MKRSRLIAALGAAAALGAMAGALAAAMISGEGDRPWSLLTGAGKSGDASPQRRLAAPVEAEFARMQRNESRFLADLARRPPRCCASSARNSLTQVMAACGAIAPD
jgi:hypothetical protein